ncbi:MAG: hypothetical protein FWB88_04620 [Defluviitaleaceae bacterium]|nr:hypothetical protein [Defluviitaleaceae bacterium]MCL2239697.1 hypothetical protein [Defluviitaleaceae bacterium]
MGEHFLIDSMRRYIGQTVTIFTTSGGLSGSGFTGVLAGICDCTVKLITDIGAPPSCPVGSACCGGFPHFGGGFEEFGFEGGRCESRCGRECRDGGRRGGMGRGRFGWNWLGSVTEIPLEKIASFTHNAL